MDSGNPDFLRVNAVIFCMQMTRIHDQADPRSAAGEPSRAHKLQSGFQVQLDVPLMRSIIPCETRFHSRKNLAPNVKFPARYEENPTGDSDLINDIEHYLVEIRDHFA